jgi:hypothetical protein
MLSVGSPSKRWGLSFGNSKDLTGFRFNERDIYIGKINGINVTFLMPTKNH